MDQLGFELVAILFTNIVSGSLPRFVTMLAPFFMLLINFIY